MKSLEAKVDDVAAALVLLDTKDMPALASLLKLFESLHKDLRQHEPILADVALKCGKLIEKLILCEVSDVDGVISSLGDAIVALQAIIRDKREYSQVKFPDQFMPIAAQPGTASQIPQQASADSKSTDKSAADILTMTFEGADTTLLAEFINEAKDHCLVAEQKMMDLETGADCKDSINAIFRSFHTIKGAATFLELNPILVVAHESETLLDLARRDVLRIEGKIADVIFASIDALRKLLAISEDGLRTGGTVDGAPIASTVLAVLREMTANPASNSQNEPPPRVGDILVDMGVTTQAEIDKAISQKETQDERLGETLVKQGVVPAQTVAHALRDQRLARSELAENSTAAKTVKEIVKVDTERLDRLVDTIGELVIAESMVGHDDEFLALAPPRISKNVSHLNKITRELQEMGMAMRLVPVRATFQKLARAVRDLTRKSGKKVELLMSGEDAEVDRSIVENIGDPLMHMIRNAVDHAIEPPTERIASQKPETGHVWLRAYHRGGNIHFEIEDDGRGLDTAKIIDKAREKGLIDSARELSEKEIHNLILLPGFSTAQKITDISGRGVGMDVVKKNIDAMRGHLEIESTKLHGTKFTMKLPLTLAMIDGMLIRLASERYIIPTMSVVESINMSTTPISTIRGAQEMINLRGTMLPIIRLAPLFELPSSESDADRVVVVVEDDDMRIGLVADELIGQRQTVIKSLGSLFSRQKWVSGGAIMSDGTVGLILDVNGLILLANNAENNTGNQYRGRSVADKGSEIRDLDESRAETRLAAVQLQ